MNRDRRPAPPCRAARPVFGAVLGLLALAVPLAAIPAVAQEPTPGPEPDPSAADARVDSLLALGRLQEAAWTLREVGDTARADSVLDRLEEILRSRPSRARPQAMDSQGVSYTWRLDHGQGVESVFKVDGSDIFCPECGAEREVGAYRVDRLLGFDLAPMTVFARIADDRGDTLSGSAMYWVHDARSSREAGVRKPDALHLFDAIIGNSDRHSDNWLVVDGRVVGIDHNRAFEYRPVTRPRTCWELQIDSIAEPGSLGAPWLRYRAVPADSVRSALDGIDSALIRRFLAMRDEVMARVQARAKDPDRALPLEHCAF
ncbi:MAG: hypothetical protein R3314_14180 [Longimicrobiales bacterium]|nr:hypothetical protein [Longimicrobiales bacterium]